MPKLALVNEAIRCDIQRLRQQSRFRRFWGRVALALRRRLDGHRAAVFIEGRRLACHLAAHETEPGCHRFTVAARAAEAFALHVEEHCFSATRFNFGVVVHGDLYQGRAHVTKCRYAGQSVELAFTCGPLKRL